MDSHDGVHLTAIRKDESRLEPILEEPEVSGVSDNSIKIKLADVVLDKILKLVNQQTLKGYSAGYEDGYNDGLKISNVFSFTYGLSTGFCAAALYLYINRKN